MLVRVLGEEETLPSARRCNKLLSTIYIFLLSLFSETHGYNMINPQYPGCFVFNAFSCIYSVLIYVP